MDMGDDHDQNAIGRRRKSTRLPQHDYSETGCYFVTFCCTQRQPLLSRVISGTLETTAAGEALERCWLGCARRWDIRLDRHVVMPDHFHGILHFLSTSKAGRTLGVVVSGVKSTATRAINEIRHTPGALAFQRGYHEHVVRDESDLRRIREYIAANPERWRERAMRSPQAVV